MLRFRTFHNTDPPLVASIWQSLRSQPGLLQPVSVDTLEQCVFGKLYFDYSGMILAFDEDRAVGFAHAGFGPTDQGDRLSTQSGVVCMLLVRPDCPVHEVASGLLEESEQYLRRHGAKSVYGGGVQPIAPFYQGMYGGCTLPGVLKSDAVAQQLYRSHGYQEVGRTLIFSLDLEKFRAPIDRQQLQHRRRMSVEAKSDPPARNWWDACTTCDFEMTRFDVSLRGATDVLAFAAFREMEPGGILQPGRTVGLMDVRVEPAHRRQGLATFTATEAFRQLASQGVRTVEAQAAESNASGIALLRKLGFQQADEAVIFRKDLNGK